VAHVLLHPDWEQKKTRNGKRLMVNEKTIERINVFNPDPDIVLEQIENAGGIDSYKGQILWQSLDGKFIYPTASYDSASRRFRPMRDWVTSRCETSATTSSYRVCS
jgi:hypothetical protein